MKRTSTILAALLCCVTAIFADLPFRNHRYDSFKVLDVTSDNIVFIGNSITDMHCWPEAFVTSNGEYLPIVNRGNSGTYSTEQSDNLESYINGKPKKVFMMIGTNDIATSGGLNASPEQVLAYVKSIVTRIHARSPQTKVYLYSILKNKTGNRVEATWLKTNELVKAYADATDKVTYIDLYDKLAGVADGGAWSYDNLHLTAGAYQAWCETICEYLAEGEDYTVSCVYPENTIDVQNNGELGRNSHGMRGTYFSCLPISTGDVLVFGDAFVKNGEWQELLGNRNVKNRGTGWNNSGDIATTSKIVDATYAAVEDVSKENAKAIFLYTGTADACGSTEIATVKANYKALVDKIAEKSPNSKIYLMAICPRNNASHNARIAELNTYMESLVTESGNIRFVDTYTPFLNNGAVNSTYVFSNDYIGGLAYVKIANLMKTALLKDFPSDTYNVTSEDVAATRYAQAGLRNQLTQVIARGLVATRGDAAGQYNATAMAAFDAQLAEASTLLAKEIITQEEVTTMANSLNEILNGALTMPTYSTEGNEVWYQLSTPNRGSKYLTSNGVGAGVTGTAANNYATSMWKFVERTDNSLDIINRHDNSYLAPTAAGSTQLTTSDAQPTKGWTLSYSDASGLFIVNSGTVQLHQTNNAEIWNWGGGANRSDAGCQYMVTLVENEPDEIPDPSLMTLTLTPNEHFANGKSTYTYHGTTTSGVWYGKLVTGTTPALTIESTDEAANNIGWSSNRPWLKAGYTYNLTLPEGYVFVGYELTTLSSSANYSNTYTYTTADGTATSEAQNNSTAKTVTAENLSTGTVALTINGDATSSNYGILITNLVVKYRELLPTLTYTIDKENGNLYNSNGSANQNWNSAWKSTATPQLVFGCGVNNMNWYNDTNVQMMAGTAESATYTLTAPEGYVIGSYSFTFANNAHDTGLTLAMTGGSTYTTTRDAQPISAENQDLRTMSFVLSGTNGKGVVLTNFTVTLVDPANAGKEDTAEALAAAKTDAKATVTANAATLDEALGYYSYTISGVKVYDVEEVTAAIDKAATVAAVEAIKATYALNVPEVGKYYRIKGKSSGKYIDAAGLNNTQMNMKAEADRDFLGSIFLLDEGSKWLNMSTNTYIKDTHSIGADKNGANTWTFVAGSIGYIKLKSNSSSPWLHDNTNTNKTDRCSSDGADHEFSLEEVHAYTITVNGPVAANATATWNGDTKKLPATWSLFEGMTVTNATLTINSASHTLTNFKEGETTITGNSIEITGLTVNRTFTTTFSPAFFSTTYGEKWVRLSNCSNPNYWATLENTTANDKGTTAVLDYTDEKQLWCLVGDAESFVLYNKAAGSELALNVPLAENATGYADGNQALLTADKGTWKLIEQDFGYALVPTVKFAGNTMGINMYGGSGGLLKLYGTAAGNKGSYWTIELVDMANPLTLNIKVSGEQPYHVNYRVAELTTTIAEQTSKSIVMGDVEARTYYLPAGATITLENTFTYRGYTFDGFKDAEGNAAEYTNATIPAGGISVTVSYSVDEDNKYQYLFYSNDPVMNKPYRIPAIAVTRKGTILAVTDHRPGGSDIGYAPVDIKIRRSDDNGITWTDEEFIADGTGTGRNVNDTWVNNVFEYAFGDAAIVADRESDEVLVMCVGGKQPFPSGTAENHNYMARLRSHDGGVTWDEPENVTAMFMDVTALAMENTEVYTAILPEAYSMFYGSGRIFQSRVFKAEGSQYYRIYAAILVREVREGETGTSNNNYVVYSDNFGESWSILGTRCVNGGDEAKVEELPDGTIIISSRKAGGRYFNIFTFTDIAKAEGSWGATATSTEVYDGGGSGTNGEIYKVKAIRNEDNAICDVMLQSVPLGPGRSNVMIHYKEMEYDTDGTNKYTPAEFATGWNRGLQVSDRASAYSTMALQTDGNFGFFYEEVPEGYCMVYVPLSLEEITNGAYSLYTVNSTITEHGIGTFYASEAMQIPEGVKAYVATEKPTMDGETGVITMTELDGIIPAHTGAVLRGEADTYEFIPSIGYGATVEGNMLEGYEAADNQSTSFSEVTLAEGYTTYVLTVMNDVAGFYRKEAGFKVYNNKAYLKVPAAVSTNALRIRFADEETTSIDALESTDSSQQSTAVYDLAGRRVEKMEKGIYIVNGRKVVK